MNFSEDNALTLAFYHGVLSSVEAEARLRAKGPGHYLLRLSSIQVDEYVLSVLTSTDQVRHLLVPRTRRSDLIVKNNLQSLAEVVQFIVSNFNASDGQNLFQFQLNEEENDTEMREEGNSNILPEKLRVTIFASIVAMCLLKNIFLGKSFSTIKIQMDFSYVIIQIFCQ